MSASTAAAPFHTTAFDPQQYEREGFFIARSFFGDELSEELKKEWERVKTALAGDQPKGSRIERNHLYLFGDMPQFFDNLCQHPRILEAARSVLGPNIALYMHRLLVKDKHFNAGIHLHQDYPYFNGGSKKLSIFVMLGKSDLNNGCVSYVKGSHKHGVKTRDTIDISEYPDLEVCTPTMTLGDVAFMDFLTWHYSGPGSMLDERPAMQIVLQPADDGSFNELTLSVPRLVCGEWQTEKFEPFNDFKASENLKKGNQESAAVADAMQAAPPTQRKQRVENRLRRLPVGVKRMVPEPVKRLIRSTLSRETPAAAAPEAAAAQIKSKRAIAALVQDTEKYLRRQGHTKIALAAATPPPAIAGDFVGFIHAVPPGAAPVKSWKGLPAVPPGKIDELDNVQALIVPTDEFLPFATAMRYLEPAMSKNIPILPAGISAAVPDHVRNGDAGQALEHSIFVRYLTCSALHGHFAEFGTFWGAAFHRSYHELKWILEGKFYAFDSFQGLSRPIESELQFTNGDFREGTYYCSHNAFRSLAARAGIPEERLVTVPGFYSESLVGVDPQEYGLTSESISVCRIDCDLLEPTSQVLEFIYPLLEPGALLYFDDWRLCRASPKVGERAAVLRWLENHPEIDLVEFHREGWQDQWFIFQKK